MRAFLAALLHDIAKQMPDDEILKITAEHSLTTDAELLANPKLLHGDVGVVIAREKFGVNDAGILDAIRSHTIGRPAMSILEKNIFVADILDHTRDTDPDIPPHAQASRASMHTLAYIKHNINAAVYEALIIKRDNTLHKGAALHPLATKALEYYQQHM